MADTSDPRDPASPVGPCRVATGITFHLAPVPVWEAQRAGARYVPEAFAVEGFVHCTDGLDRLAASGARHLRADPRSYVALELDLDRIPSEARYDADPPVFPHLYGPVPTAAVISVRPAERSADGSFTGFGAPKPRAGGG